MARACSSCCSCCAKRASASSRARDSASAAVAACDDEGRFAAARAAAARSAAYSPRARRGDATAAAVGSAALVELVVPVAPAARKGPVPPLVEGLLRPVRVPSLTSPDPRCRTFGVGESSAPFSRASPR
eukprot:6195019-Pleurochrysis_carterae.AAC.1